MTSTTQTDAQTQFKLEICCTGPDDVAAARAGGADRAELCMALTAEGVTPSAGCIAASIKAAGEMPVTVLIRPREGDFVYTRADIEAMLTDIRAAKAAGAAGVTIGALTDDGDIDIGAMRLMTAAAKPEMEVTFHRAFDVCRDPAKALETLIELRCDRVLTSGQAASSVEGATKLAQLVAQADGRIEIMPGGGVRPANIAALQKATGARQFHSSARGKAVAAGDKADDGLFGTRPQPVCLQTVKDLKSNLP